jgi:hypothetical protein
VNIVERFCPLRFASRPSTRPTFSDVLELGRLTELAEEREAKLQEAVGRHMFARHRNTETG